MIGITIGPVIAGQLRSCRRCPRRSYIAAQIHIAGGIWISVRRQLESRIRTPPKSSAMPPTASASGANSRWRRLRSSTTGAISASSPSRTARTTSPSRFRHSCPVTSTVDGRTVVTTTGAPDGDADAEDQRPDHAEPEGPFRPLVALVQLPGLLHRDQRGAGGDVEPGIEDVFDSEEGEQVFVIHHLADLVPIDALVAPAEEVPDRRQKDPPAGNRRRLLDPRFGLLERLVLEAGLLDLTHGLVEGPGDEQPGP